MTLDTRPGLRNLPRQLRILAHPAHRLQDVKNGPGQCLGQALVQDGEVFIFVQYGHND